MFCPYCGNKIPDSTFQKTCSFCGASLAAEADNGKTESKKAEKTDKTEKRKPAPWLYALIGSLGVCILLAVILVGPLKGYIHKLFEEELAGTASQADATPADTHSPEDAEDVPDPSEQAEPTAEEEATTEAETEETTEKETEATTEATTAKPMENGKYTPGNYVNSNTTTVNLRSSPSVNGALCGRLLVGETVKVLEVREIKTSNPQLRWWGKIRKGGKDCWAAMYFLSSVDVGSERHSRDELKALWNRMLGYWNCSNKNRFAGFAKTDEGLQFLCAPWDSEFDIVAYAQGGFTGNPEKTICLRLKSADGERSVDCQLYLDVSEIDNGRVAWNYGYGWEAGGYAGKDMDAARAKRGAAPGQ